MVFGKKKDPWKLKMRRESSYETEELEFPGANDLFQGILEIEMFFDYWIVFYKDTQKVI